MKWPGAIQVELAKDFTMIGNSVAGGEKVGYRMHGVPCSDATAHERVRDNEVRLSLHTLGEIVKDSIIFTKHFKLTMITKEEQITSDEKIENFLVLKFHINSVKRALKKFSVEKS